MIFLSDSVSGANMNIGLYTKIEPKASLQQTFLTTCTVTITKSSGMTEITILSASVATIRVMTRWTADIWWTYVRKLVATGIWYMGSTHNIKTFHGLHLPTKNHQCSLPVIFDSQSPTWWNMSLHDGLLTLRHLEVDTMCLQACTTKLPEAMIMMGNLWESTPNYVNHWWSP